MTDDDVLSQVLHGPSCHWVGWLQCDRCRSGDSAPDDDDRISDTCHRCGKPAAGPTGTIYVRAQVDGRWQSVAQCCGCCDATREGEPVVVSRPPNLANDEMACILTVGQPGYSDLEVALAEDLSAARRERDVLRQALRLADRQWRTDQPAQSSERRGYPWD